MLSMLKEGRKNEQEVRQIQSSTEHYGVGHENFSNQFQFMTAYRRENILVTLVHEEFEKFAVTSMLRQAMPNLRKLSIEQGLFSLRTAQLFNPVETLTLDC